MAGQKKRGDDNFAPGHSCGLYSVSTSYAIYCTETGLMVSGPVRGGCGPAHWSRYSFQKHLVVCLCRSGYAGPFYEANKLIVIGLYRYVRNPMYVGVMMTLLAESWFFWSSRLLIYTGVCFVVANLLVVGYEENRLRYKYGDEFLRYCENVRRWIPGKPYNHVG